MASESLLESVAQHEGTLIEDLDRTREEARQIIEAAHAAGASLQQETNTQLDAEVAAIRREAAQARDGERTKIQNETTARVEQIRSASASNAPAVRDALIAQIIPSLD